MVVIIVGIVVVMGGGGSVRWWWVVVVGGGRGWWWGCWRWRSPHIPRMFAYVPVPHCVSGQPCYTEEMARPHVIGARHETEYDWPLTVMAL